MGSGKASEGWSIELPSLLWLYNEGSRKDDVQVADVGCGCYPLPGSRKDVDEDTPLPLVIWSP